MSTKYPILGVVISAFMLLAYWVMCRIRVYVTSRVLCGHRIAQRDCDLFAGMVVAVDPTTSAIIEVDRNHGSLRAAMRERWLGRSYEIVQIPPINPMESL